MIEGLWKKVRLVGGEYRKKVRAIVEKIAEEIAKQHGDEIGAKLKEFGVTGILSIKIEDPAPTNIYPCLYLIVPMEEYYKHKFAIDGEFYEELGKWASHAKLKIEVVHEGSEDMIEPKIKVWGK